MAQGQYPPSSDPAWMMQGSPSGYRAQNILHTQCSSDTAPLTTQVLTTVAVPLEAGDIVTNITFISGATAANTPTNYWFALYSIAGALLAQTADQTSTAWAADTVKTLALSSAQLISTSGIYYVGIMVKATAVPSLAGVTLARAAFAGSIVSSKILSQTSGSGLTTTAPATIASPTTIAAVPLAICT